MAEYIERGLALELIRRQKRDDATPYCVGYSEGWNEALEQIECNIEEDIPIADVRPERHGEWLGNYTESDDFHDEWCECSLCGFRADDNDFHYCPHCGAKMDGKGGNSDV